MDTERDVTRIVRSWLRTDEHESADRVLDDVLALLDATPQRRSWWPTRRIADMNTFAKLGIAVAAVVVIAVVGFNLLPGTSGVGGGPAASPPPTVAPSPTNSPAPFPPTTGALGVGRQTLIQNSVALTLDFSQPGWFSRGVTVPPDGVWIQKGTMGLPESVWMLSWSIDGVYEDPCGDVPAASVSPSAADLAAAVAGLPGVDVVKAPSDVTVGGLPAKHVAITVRKDIACSPGDFLMWYDDVTCDGVAPCSRWATELGQTNRVWIVEVDGTHIWIEAETYEGASPEVEQEVQRIIDSIQFE